MSALPISIIAPNQSGCLVVGNKHPIKGDMEHKDTSTYPPHGMDGVIASLYWELLACDDEDGNELSGDLEAFIRSPHELRAEGRSPSANSIDRFHCFLKNE